MSAKSQQVIARTKDHADRRSLILVAAVTTVLAGIHLTDHVLRGDRVRHLGLDPTWNHSGWPFTDQVTPFTFSLVIVTITLVGGLILTVLEKAWAGYWLGAAILLGAIVTFVHFLPTAKQESPQVISGSWSPEALLGTLAVVVTFAIVGSLLVMGYNAVRVYRRSGTWT
ncbi:MAG: hypothetical protein M3313_02300 [Actinomycetota bacterium]|nr:hypothetical protein [Actinomycetota bacterium]